MNLDLWIIAPLGVARCVIRGDRPTQPVIRRVCREVLVDPSLVAQPGARPSLARRFLPLLQWSNPSLKDHLALFTHGVADQWAVPRTAGQDYFDQMTADVREEREDSRGRIKVVWVQKRRDNHYLDCELKLHTAAVISGLLNTAESVETASAEGTAG